MSCLLTSRQSILTGLTIGLLIFQLAVLTFLVFFPYLPDPGFSDLNNNIYVLLAPLSTILLLGVLYAWLIRLDQIQPPTVGQVRLFYPISLRTLQEDSGVSQDNVSV